jgi:two-component system response regulator PhoP
MALIEDDPDQRESLLTWLNLEGHSIWAVESAEAFYKQFSVTPIDIAIIDLGLPGEDGLEVIRHLREHTGIGLIVVSARSRVDDRLQGIALGADHYLVKPIVLEELALHIDNLWQRIGQSSVSDPRGTWVLFQQQRELQTPDGVIVTLTPSELLIVELLARRNEPVHRSELVVALGADPKLYDMHRIDAHLNRLRGKLKKQTDEAFPIISLPAARLQIMGSMTIL